MFSRLHVNGFRSFEGFEINHLGRFNIVVGPGDTGKTNLLEAVFLACSNGDASLLHREQGLRRVRLDELLPNEVVGYFDYTWSVWNQTRQFTIDATWDGVRRTVTCKRVERPDAVLIAGDSARQDTSHDDEYPKDAIAIYRVETRLNGKTHVGDLVVTPLKIIFRKLDTIENVAARYVHPFFQNLSRQLPHCWTQVEDSQEQDSILELLRSLDRGVKDVRVAATEVGLATMRVNHELLGRAPLEVFGAGFGKALSIAAYTVAAKNGVLIVDELDASLHVGGQGALIEFLLRSAARHNVQLFASTHSLETLDTFLDAFDKVSDLFSKPEDLQILQVSKKEGRTEVKQADATEARKLREELGLDLRRTV